MVGTPVDLVYVNLVLIPLFNRTGGMLTSTALNSPT